MKLNGIEFQSLRKKIINGKKNKVRYKELAKAFI